MKHSEAIKKVVTLSLELSSLKFSGSFHLMIAIELVPLKTKQNKQ
jgi:hypothetical protein